LGTQIDKWASKKSAFSREEHEYAEQSAFVVQTVFWFAQKLSLHDAFSVRHCSFESHGAEQKPFSLHSHDSQKMYLPVFSSYPHLLPRPTAPSGFARQRFSMLPFMVT
jgi:hypothetical protein